VGTVAIWIVSLPDVDAPDPHAWRSLSDAERARAGRFRNPVDRASYVHGRAALRALLDRRLERPLDRRPFDVMPSGKPCLSGASIAFSFSRSRQRAAVAIVDGGSIGVDIEAIVPDETSAEVARANFPAGDIAWLMAAADDHDRLRRFYRLWVIREAVLKADGDGLTRPLAAIRIAIDGDELRLADESRWTIVEAPPLDGYAAAAAIPRRSAVTWTETCWSELRSG
jgi:4'-phosphopantetheinyl transferase